MDPLFWLPKSKKQNAYDLTKDAFELIIGLIGILNMLSLILYRFLYPSNPVLVSVFIIGIIFCYIVVCLVRKNVEYRIYTIIMVIYVEFFMFPVYIFYGEQTSSTTPIWITASLFVMFFILENKDLIWLFVASFYVLTYIYFRKFIFGDPVIKFYDPFQFYLGFAFCFVSVSVALFFVIVIQERNLKAFNDDMEKNREIVQSAGAAKSRFLANMSNEIRTPMNSIIGLSELALKDEMSDSTRNELNVIKKSSYDLLDIIDDVLMYSKLDSGKMSLMPVDFRFDILLRQVLESINVMSNKKDIKIRVSIDHNIPKVLYGDDIRIRQIFLRLLFISLQLTENGRIVISVKCERNETDDKALFTCSVADTGAGLSQADLDAIYEAYDTYDSRQNSNLKGICLKFSICKELLDLMGGNIDIRSIEGIGLNSVFTFQCDIKNPDPMISVTDAEKKKVLIFVGGERDISTYKNIMEGFGIRPVYANSYFAFERIISNNKFDYIFIPQDLFPKVSNVVASYKVDETTYVIADSNHSYGDFDKCRILLQPVTCLSIADVLNDKWKAEDYIAKNEEVEYDGSLAKVLVVDDNSVNLKVASGIFSHYKIDIDIAKSGEEALRKLEKNEYHLVLMDMVMPEMSGLEALQMMRNSEIKSMREVPVVALTATTGGNVREEILEQGFQEYLAKPIKTRYLTQVLLTFLPPGVLKKVTKEVVKEQPKNDNDLTKQENILDTYKGISTIGYNEDSYCAILNTYYSEGMRKLTDLPNYLEAGNIQLFTTDVHGIKSSSASIGAMTVSKMFKELEFAGKDGNVELIKEKFDPYVEAFKKIMEDVKQYLTDKGKFEYIEKVEVNDFEGVDEEELSVTILETLKDFIDKMNLKESDKMMEELPTRNFGTENNEWIVKLKKAYDMFDFHEVKALLNVKLGIETTDNA